MTAARVRIPVPEPLLLASPLACPPTCGWEVSEGNAYAAFLSHYKVEAGSDARYLKDLLQKMLQRPVFLDSNELSDLRRLFTDGRSPARASFLPARSQRLHPLWDVAVADRLLHRKSG